MCEGRCGVLARATQHRQRRTGATRARRAPPTWACSTSAALCVRTTSSTLYAAWRREALWLLAATSRGYMSACGWCRPMRTSRLWMRLRTWCKEEESKGKSMGV